MLSSKKHVKQHTISIRKDTYFARDVGPTFYEALKSAPLD